MLDFMMREHGEPMPEKNTTRNYLIIQSTENGIMCHIQADQVDVDTIPGVVSFGKENRIVGQFSLKDYSWIEDQVITGLSGDRK
jgi:hypothetical protein